MSSSSRFDCRCFSITQTAPPVGESPGLYHLLGRFKDPVTIACGHSFCKPCLQIQLSYGDSSCPLCKKHLSSIPNMNIVPRDLVQQVQDTPAEDEYTGAPGEVACDSCTGTKLKAKKSCLMCLNSYCSAHLEFHLSTERLKGHKLVEPVEDLDSRACLAHGRPLELFCRKYQNCICVLCLEQGHHEVVSTENEWNKKMVKLENIKAELQWKIADRKQKIDEINTTLKSCQDQLEVDWWDIETVFRAVITIVEEVQAVLLQPLTDRRILMEKQAKDLQSQLEEEIFKFESAISEINDMSLLDDHIHFLQRYPSLQDPVGIKDWTEVELDTSLSFGTMRKTTMKMMERIQEELEKLTVIELKRVSVFAEDIQLDPGSAHRHLVVSKDQKRVQDGGQDQDVADNPRRFNFLGSIVGLESFSSGRAYWEVEVSNKTGWDLGVVRGEAHRKENHSVNPDNGYWVVVQDDDKYAALTAPPLHLRLEKKPEKVGVFVDYKEGLVSFYNVTAQSHIYSFTECVFRDDLYPYFGPHAKRDGKNSEPLIISAVKQ